MRKWGIVISAFYAAIVLGLLVPAGVFLSEGRALPAETFLRDLQSLYGTWISWVPIAVLISGQALLLFLSVDASFKKLKPRTHIAVSVTVGSMLFALLVFAGLSAAGAAVEGDAFFDHFWISEIQVIAIWAAIWLIWGVAFYLYARGSFERASRVVSWLLKGSVLELLIAVPCHVWVRRRDDCSAPVATSFGIVAGIAVMLMCFGPSVLFLVKKRLDGYSVRKSA